MRPDLVIPDVWPRDEKLWVPLSDGVWSRPLHFRVSSRVVGEFGVLKGHVSGDFVG
jgi:hypothetical protein